MINRIAGRCLEGLEGFGVGPGRVSPVVLGPVSDRFRAGFRGLGFRGLGFRGLGFRGLGFWGLGV